MCWCQHLLVLECVGAGICWYWWVLGLAPVGAGPAGRGGADVQLLKLASIRMDSLSITGKVAPKTKQKKVGPGTRVAWTAMICHRVQS